MHWNLNMKKVFDLRNCFIVATLRRPHIPIEDIIKGKTSPDQGTEKNNRITYSIEYLARLAMSPLCLVYPNDWERISHEYPALVKKVRGIIKYELRCVIRFCVCLGC